MVQKTVTSGAIGTGVAGEFYSTQPQRTRTKILTSANAALNLVGVVLTQVVGQEDQAGVAASGVFAGILGFPKSLPRDGLDPETVVPNGTAVEGILQGYVVVNLTGAAAIGDFVYFSNATGVLDTAAPGVATPAGHSRVPGGTVQIKNVAGAGLGVIYLDDAGDATEPV